MCISMAIVAYLSVGSPAGTSASVRRQRLLNAGLLGVAFDTFCWVATGLRSAVAQERTILDGTQASMGTRSVGVSPW